MFGSIGMQEVVLILFILLLLFGAKRLPELGESLGKGIREFKRGVSEIKEDIESDDQRKGDST
ncbi:MAG: twin-arginine translocase TatA/TatE family subunit [Gemmatimonadota bacterium]|jgi:sec-independent protein translocase protein TatA